MGTINQTSVREELDRLKNEYSRLSKQSAISTELQLLMQSMFTLLELICAIFLEKTTPKTNKNSSKPSSQTGKDESALLHTGSQGKGKPEKQQTSQHQRTVETCTLVTVTQCANCAEDLTGIASTTVERRTKIDILFEKVVEHFGFELWMSR